MSADGGGAPGGGAVARVPPLDGLRGLAILLVLVHHLVVMVPRTSLDWLVVNGSQLGWCGVDLFFVLSGFLITRILLAARDGTSYFSSFYARRILRIFPLYYAVVAVSLLLLPNLGELAGSELVSAKLARFGAVDEDAVFYWTYLSNLSIARAGAFRHGILDVSWSLAIEEQFYLLWPLLVVALRRRALMAVCVGAIVCALLFRCWLLMQGAHPISIYVLTPARMDALAIGCWIALRAAKPGVVLERARAARWLLPVCAAGALGAVCFDRVWFVEVAGPLGSWAGPAMQSVGYTFVAGAFGALLVNTLQASPGGWWARSLVSRPLVTLGKYSYALYLCHLPLRAVLRDVVFGPNQPHLSPLWRFPTLGGSELPGQLLFFALALAVSLGTAFVSWHVFERWFLELKRWFPYGAKREEGDAPAPARAAPGSAA